LKYWVDYVRGIPTAFVEIGIPLSSSLVGHNYLHAGLDSIRVEITGAGLLTRIALHVLGFTPDEVARFMKGSKPQLLELTWHNSTASARARLNAQKRIKAFFDAQLLNSGRHDIAVRDVDYQEGNGKPCLLVTFKSGDKYRMYGKIDQVMARTKKSRKVPLMPSHIRLALPKMRKMIGNDVRSELLVGPKTLQQFNAGHPNDWTDGKLTEIIEYLWAYMGFPPKRGVRGREAHLSRLSNQAEETWNRYLAKGDVAETIPAYTLSRHRKSIKKATGRDIGTPFKKRVPRPENVGYQFRYDRRNEIKGTDRRLFVNEVTGPALTRELRRGLAFLETGEIPEFVDEKQRDIWLARWKSFIEQERGLRITPQYGRRPDAR
jgi:hypothetical protein